MAIKTATANLPLLFFCLSCGCVACWLRAPLRSSLTVSKGCVRSSEVNGDEYVADRSSKIASRATKQARQYKQTTTYEADCKGSLTDPAWLRPKHGVFNFLANPQRVSSYAQIMKHETATGHMCTHHTSHPRMSLSQTQPHTYRII